MFDLSKNDPSKLSEAGFTFNLELPNGTVTEAKITVRGSQSPAVKNYGRRKYQEFKQREAAAKRRGREPEDLTLEEAEELAVEAAVIRTISWEGMGEDGKELVFSPEEATRLYAKYPFIRSQVTEKADDINNFFR